MLLQGLSLIRNALVRKIQGWMLVTHNWEDVVTNWENALVREEQGWMLVTDNWEDITTNWEDIV
jgi:hypothetical protein